MKSNIIYEDIKKINLDLSKMKDKSVLITGASGLIGIYLLAYIKSQQEKYNITIYTWTKNFPNKIFESLFEDCASIVGDITVKELYKNIPKIDYIIHCAGYGQPSVFLADEISQIKTIQINTIVTLWLLEKLKKNGTFIFMSSSEVYDGLDERKITEEQIGITNTNHPRACYIESKKCGETICYS
jgi:UDP-glucuronate decarboxylase